MRPERVTGGLAVERVRLGSPSDVMLLNDAEINERLKAWLRT
jgi:hypothetical protein